MVNKTFSKILSFGLGIVIITSLVTVFVYHSYYDKQAKSELESVASVVVAQLNSADDKNFDYINNAEKSDIRLTLISSDGTVLADSMEDAKNMGSHADRPEFKEALSGGEGSTIRKSATLDKSTYYYAKKLKNGNVLRVAVTAQTVYIVFYKALVINAAVALVVMLLSLALSYAITKSIIKPVTELGENLNDIESVDTYEELQPFVDEIKEQREKQKLLDKQKKEFTANVSHELKTPLTSIAGYAELIENGMAKPEDVVPFAHTIRKQALRLVSLSEDIIQLSQLDESDGKVVFESVDLAKISQNAIEALEVNAQAKGVTLKYEGDDSCYIKGNSSLLDELVYNLCDNAIRYNKPDGEVTVKVLKVPTGALLTVSDTGIGIPEKYQQRIFERFFRVDKSRSKASGGTGLGLAIVKHIAEVHDAHISVSSVEGVGTTIEIEFNS